MWSQPKQVVVDKAWCLNRQNGADPATESLDHRARACYLPCGLSYNELCHAWQCALTLSYPLCIIERALH